MVYEGQWQSVRVVVKVFPFGARNNLPQKAVSAIDRELGVLSALRHPHIVQLYGYFQEATRTGLVMEHCVDGDLGAYYPGKPLAVKLSLAAQLLAALRYLHVQRPPITHGDVKVRCVLDPLACSIDCPPNCAALQLHMQPQNVLIQHGQAKLSDFGMSAGAVLRTSTSVRTQSSIVPAGTSCYAAPEVLSGGRRALSPGSDMYSFGMLVYHLVEEEAPWSGEDPGFVFRQVTAGVLPSFDSQEWTLELRQFVAVRLSMVVPWMALCTLTHRLLHPELLLHRATGSMHF